MRYSLNGRIVADDDAPVLRWWGLSAVCPADIRQAIAENPADEEFTLEINSPGGSVFAGFEMYSVLRRASRDGVRIRAEVQSLAGSAASVAMVGADTVACSPVAQVMIHLPLTVTEGNQNVHRESVQMLESITESIIAGYERKVGKLHQLRAVKTITSHRVSPLPAAVCSKSPPSRGGYRLAASTTHRAADRG